MKTFGERLRAMRKAKGLTQVQLGEKSGVYHQLISRYERGAGMPTMTTLEWLVVALDTTSTELLGF